MVHAVEMRPGGGAKLARSAGSSVQLMSKEGSNALLRLPSGEMRAVPLDCRATVGQVGNPESELVKIGKAGRNRLEGQAAADPWRSDEPRRPPARWWRGPQLGWAPPGQPVGQARGQDS